MINKTSLEICYRKETDDDIRNDYNHNDPMRFDIIFRISTKKIMTNLRHSMV